jgi:hypothetical protein
VARRSPVSKREAKTLSHSDESAERARTSMGLDGLFCKTRKQKRSVERNEQPQVGGEDSSRDGERIGNANRNAKRSET